MSRIPPPQSPLHESNKSLTSTTSPSLPHQKSEAGVHLEDSKQDSAVSSTGSPFFSMPIPAINLHMDMRNLKWNWPAYLTLGKTQPSQSPKPSSVADMHSSPASHPAQSKELGQESDAEGETEGTIATEPNIEAHQHPDNVEVDFESLFEAMINKEPSPLSLLEAMIKKDLLPPSLHDTSSHSEPSSQDDSGIPQSIEPQDSVGLTNVTLDDESHAIEASTDSDVDNNPLASSSSPVAEERVAPFRSTTIFLDDPSDTLRTRRAQLSHLTVGDRLLDRCRSPFSVYLFSRAII